jgi:hypothetical protein
MIWLGHAVLFFFSGFAYWLLYVYRHNLGVILTIALPFAGVYFLGWWALLTFFLGIFFASRMYVKAILSGKDPYSNPWKQSKED